MRTRKQKRSDRIDKHPSDVTTAVEKRREAAQTCEPSNLRKRRVSSRNQSSALADLASNIVGRKNVVLVSGAGLSVASGIRPFRSNPKMTEEGHRARSPTCDKKNRKKRGILNKSKSNSQVLEAGLWNDVIWQTATRACFRKDPVAWYRDFWIPHFATGVDHIPNVGHKALDELSITFPNVCQITQNIDGLQKQNQSIVEVHGRASLYKCCPDSDSDTDSDSDDESERVVSLGHRRKHRKNLERFSDPTTCPYQYLESLTAGQLLYPTIGNRPESQTSLVPICPVCENIVMPQALLFDEGYHSHTFYKFQLVEDMLAEADVLVFVGTSFAVQLTVLALQHARRKHLPVYNFNLAHDVLQSTVHLNVTNIVGPATETLPKLLDSCLHALRIQTEENSIEAAASSQIEDN